MNSSTALPVLQTCEKNSTQMTVSLANLIEQRGCVERVDRRNVILLAPFPDLRERLLSKLSHEVDVKVEALHENLQPLKEQKDCLCQAREDVWLLLSNHSLGPDYNTLLAGTPTVPSLKMMLDWIDSAEKQIRELYCARTYYLDNVAEQSLVNSDNFAALWKEDAHLLLELLSDCQAHLKFFLEEKI